MPPKNPKDILTKIIPEWRFIALIAGVHILTRIVYYLMGMRFDAWEHSNPMQFIFPEFLTKDLWRSLFYLQSQPPLYNLFLGTVMQAFPHTDTVVFTGLYYLMGVALSVSVYLLMRWLRISRPFALLFAILFAAAPETVLFENLLLYTYPVTLMIVLAALCLHRFGQKNGMAPCIGFFSLLAAIVLTRSLFHLIWYLFFLALILMVLWQKRRTILIAAAVPLLLILFVYGKNYYLFGHFSASSWLGASFAKVTTFSLSEEERLRLAERGEISELAFIPAIQGLWVYHDKARVPSFKKRAFPLSISNITQVWATTTTIPRSTVYPAST